MDTRQLFRAAMGPYRFRSLIEATGSFAGHAADAPALKPAHGPIGHQVGVPQTGASYLVPGGRFFLTFDCNVLALWDFGLVGSVSQPRRMAHLDFPPGTFIGFEAGLKAFEISSFSETGKSSFRHLGELLLDKARGVRQVVVHGDRAIFDRAIFESTEFVIWDFVSSMYVVVKRVYDGFTSSPLELEKIYIHNALIELGEKSLRITDVPPDFVLNFGKPVTSTPVSLDTAEQQSLPTPQVLQYPPPDDIVDESRCFSGVINRHQAQLPLLFDIHRPYRSYTGIARLSFNFTRTPLGEIVPSPLTCIAKRAFPAGCMFGGSDMIGSLHVPDGFSKPVMRSIPMTLTLDNMAESESDAHEFIYSTAGAGETLNRCSLPGCRKEEVAKGTHKFCSGCRLVCYCSAKCQKRHWKPHKEVCKEQSQCIASGVVAPPMRIVKLVHPGPFPNSLLSNLGICAGSGRMVTSLLTGSYAEAQRRFNGVVLISDFLA
ncbi:hypothetical protein DFP72DRAFT_1070517 [Ephemerocybe angulata]|uniref:MYND-type domain-containing protein n=1 Tax=Ephemerocybe angulata TaxID=980116 RepID=A0A8H6HS78_9AGAR|nr:hypothetical protein DFP72DRAFT_1070517 [Tulosesus angulatus]